MTDRERIMAGFVIRRRLQVHHRPSTTSFDLHPMAGHPAEATEAARRELHDLMRAALPDGWRVAQPAVGIAHTAPEEPYVGDAERHWGRIDAMMARLRDAGVEGAGMVASLPAGWLTLMERASKAS